MEKENVLFISDIDRTLIFPKRFARDGDVCIEWTKDGKELNYINPDNLHVLVRLSKRIKLVLITARTKEQYERIRWPVGLELHSVLLCFGNEVYFSQEIEQNYEEKHDYGLGRYGEILCNAFDWLKSKDCFIKCGVGDDRFISAQFKPDVSDNYKSSLKEDLYCELRMESYICDDRFYAVPINNTKGDAVLALAKLLKPDAIVVAGDSAPDAPMFSFADCAIYPNTILDNICCKNTSLKKLMRQYGKESLTKYNRAINCIFRPGEYVSGFTNYVIKETTDFVTKELKIKV